jgi:hypothetical protein
VIGPDGATASPSPGWEWPRTRHGATTLHGFTDEFSYEDAAATSSIAVDGAWLQAVSVYEDYLNPGRRPQLDTGLDKRAGPHVRSATVAMGDDELVRFLVTVEDGDGAPAADARVTVAWTGEPLPDAAREDATVVEECETDAGGACLVALSLADFAGRRPVRVAVTHVEHGRVAYAPHLNHPSAIATIE